MIQSIERTLPGPSLVYGLQMFLAMQTEIRRFEVDIFDVRGGIHDAGQYTAVSKSERMAQFMQSFLEAPICEDAPGWGKTVKLVVEAKGGKHRGTVVQLRLTEDEGEDGDEKIVRCYAQKLVCRGAVLLEQGGQQSRRMILFA